MPVEMVKCWGMLKPGNIELPTDNSPLRAPSTSESISTLPKPEGFRFFGSSRDGWSPARVRAVDAECWAYQRAARQATIVESAALAKDYEGPEPGATDEDIREPLKMPARVVKCCGLFRPQDIDPWLFTGISPPRSPVSESKPSVFQEKGFRFAGSSRDRWSPARVRAANAECQAFHQAAQQAALDETAAWAKENQGPEPGATDEDIRIYTQLDNGEYRYWGVQDLDETMQEFWARNDPDNTRERIAYQDSGPLPTIAKLTPSKSPPPRPRTASNSKRRQETPEGPRHRFAKPAMVTPTSKKSIRKSLASEIEDRDSTIDEQIQDISNRSNKEPTVVTNVLGISWLDQAEMSQTISGVNSSTSNSLTMKAASTSSTRKAAARGRPRKIRSGVVDSASSNPANWPMSTREDPPKRKRGRPAKEKYPIKSQDLPRSHGSNEKQKRPKAESKAKVTKPKPRNGRPIAPSFHKMRTRARGSAENLQRL